MTTLSPLDLAKAAVIKQLQAYVDGDMMLAFRGLIRPAPTVLVPYRLAPDWRGEGYPLDPRVLADLSRVAIFPLSPVNWLSYT